MWIYVHAKRVEESWWKRGHDRLRAYCSLSRSFSRREALCSSSTYICLDLWIFFLLYHFYLSFFHAVIFSRRWIILFCISLVSIILYYFIEKWLFYHIWYQLVFYFFFSRRPYLSHLHLFPFTFFGLLHLRSRLSSSVLLNPAKPHGLTSREPAGPRTNSNNSHVSSTTRPSLKDNKAVRR
jgi:hypothetical protein